VPLLLTVLVYARALDGELQFDDHAAIANNPEVKVLGGFVRGAFLDGYARAGRPVADLTFAANYAAGGLAPWNFHATNLAIHLAAVLLAWALGRELLRLAGAARAEWLALAAAGLFALHPLQTQAVSYIVQRGESLASALYMASLLCLLAAERRGLRGRAWTAVAAAGLLFALALGTKAIAVTLPVAWLLAVALLPSPETRADLASWRRRALAAAPFVVAGALHALRAVTLTAGAAEIGFDVAGATPWTYLLTQLRVVATYLRLLFWPTGQSVDWDFPLSTGLGEPAVLLCGALLLSLAAGGLWLALGPGRRRAGEGGAAARVSGVGVLWFFLLLAPTSSVIPIVDVLMEHRVYLASLGIFLAVVVAADLLAARFPAGRRVAVAALLAVWATAAVAVHQRNRVWESGRALWTDAAEKAPRKARPLQNLAWVASQDGRPDEALRLAEEALKRAAPGDLAEASAILEDRGVYQLMLGRPWDARASLYRALELGGRSTELFVNLSALHVALVEYAEAERMAMRAVASNARSADAWCAASIAAHRGDRVEEALARAQRAVVLAPELAEARFVLGQALHALGRDREACAAWSSIPPRTDPALPALLAQAGCPR
jgi:tetratricopeptide (TPR) repeat protein